MSKVYGAVLKEKIAKESAMEDFIFNDEDNKILHEMLQEINALGYNINYLAELEAFHVPNSDKIVAKYINLFTSEATKAYLVPQLVIEKVANRDRIILDLYTHFRSSNEYITDKGKPSSAHIYVRYDNAFHKIKSKRIMKELCQIIINPRDMHYLHFTTKMLASWKIPELKNVFCEYLRGKTVSPQDVGLPDDYTGYFPPLEYIRKDLLFTSIDCLKYYPDEEALRLIEYYENDNDVNIRIAANNVLKAIKKL